MGRRSMGNGQYGPLYGRDYRQTANDNLVVVIMIETPLWRGERREDRLGSWRRTSSLLPASIWVISPDTSRAIRNGP